MFSPFMGMGMGMPMGPMGMPMMPMVRPIPGVMPGMPGMGFYNSLPGRFGRDMLGRDFAGPGGVGSSQPYRPPDPSALPPMPYGLPFIARPGQEGFDQYGRMIPPELPEGFDGWGRPIVSATAQGPQPPNIAPAGGPPPPQPGEAEMMGAGGQAPPMTAGTRDMPITTESGGTFTGTTSGTGRPEQPACFDRQPAPMDSQFRYTDFEPFSLPAPALNHTWELHIPRELVGHDVSEEDWARFVEDLAREALQNAPHDWRHRDRNRLGGKGRGPEPVLSDGVHSLLASWAVAFFAPRGIRVYAAQDGKRVIPPPLDPASNSRGYSRPDEFSDEESELDNFQMGDDDDDWLFEETQARRDDAYLSRRERELRKDERARIRRREKKKNRDLHVERAGRGITGRKVTRGDWEVHFVAQTPTVWVPGARPRTYGEPINRLRR